MLYLKTKVDQIFLLTIKFHFFFILKLLNLSAI